MHPKGTKHILRTAPSLTVNFLEHGIFAAENTRKDLFSFDVSLKKVVCTTLAEIVAAKARVGKWTALMVRTRVFGTKEDRILVSKQLRKVRDNRIELKGKLKQLEATRRKLKKILHGDKLPRNKRVRRALSRIQKGAVKDSSLPTVIISPPLQAALVSPT